MSASRHAGIMHYRFPQDGEKHIIVDLSHYLPTGDETAYEQMYSNGHLEVSENGTMYSGWGIWR